METIGYCKECVQPVSKNDALPDHPNIYECSNCGHPHTKDELIHKNLLTKDKT